MDFFAVSSCSLFLAKAASTLDFSLLSAAISASKAALRAFSFWNLQRKKLVNENQGG
jgi:hypothetical protein